MAMHTETRAFLDVGWYGPKDDGTYRIEFRQGDWLYGTTLESFSSKDATSSVETAERLMERIHSKPIVWPHIYGDTVVTLAGGDDRAVLDWYAKVLNVFRVTPGQDEENDSLHWGQLKFSTQAPVKHAGLLAFNLRKSMSGFSEHARALGAEIDGAPYIGWGGYTYQVLVDPWGNRFAVYGVEG